MRIESDIVAKVIINGQMALSIKEAEPYHKYIRNMLDELLKLDLTQPEVDFNNGLSSIMLMVLGPGSKSTNETIYKSITLGVIPAFLIEKFSEEMFKRDELVLAYKLSKHRDSLLDIELGPFFGRAFSLAILKPEVKHEENRNTTIQ
jgi:hypothetical protein